MDCAQKTSRSRRLVLVWIAVLFLALQLALSTPVEARTLPGKRTVKALVGKARRGVKRARGWLQTRGRWLRGRIPIRRASTCDGAAATLVLVRHGQSIWNLQNRFTGWTDVPLTEKGRREACRAGTLVKDVAFDKAYTSGLRRAQDTLSLMMKTYGKKLPVDRSTALNERHYGHLQGLNKAKTAERVGADIVHKWRRSWDIRPPGGESLKDTAKRCMPYFNRNIRKDLKRGKNVLVVAHGNSLRAIVADLEGISPKEVPKLHIDTGVPLVYQIGRDGKVINKSIRR
jgi:2,3-bisphosphoglycerate-dependent phosphoglycerate mutase